ncbi:MAG: hypothetical protein LBR00_04995, partial [Clostridiales Family XIII bacterium]|nr:hypothetical protein [Clostridiales Family XIII bacterium]
MVIRNNGNRIAALVLALAVALLLGACGGGENVAAAGDSAAAGSSAGDAASAPVATDAPKNAGGTVAVDVS